MRCLFIVLEHPAGAGVDSYIPSESSAPAIEKIKLNNRRLKK